MSQADLLSVGPGAEKIFAKAHQDDHNRFSAKTKTPFIIIDPMNLSDPQSRAVFLLDHQLAHQAVNLFFGTTGPDLSELDWNDPQAVQAWIDLNFLDHQSWASVSP